MFNKNKTLYVVEFNKQINAKTTKQFYKDMEFVRKNKAKAIGVLIRLNCPGGSPSLSYEIAEYLEAIKKEITVYIYVESMAASGGYFIASAGDKIYSNPFAVVGSIGVIMQKFEASGLADKLGVHEDNVTVGNYKQPVSLFKPIDSEGEEYLKKQLMIPIYDLFVDYISKKRKIDKDKVKSDFADGRIFVATEAVGTLVDEVITFHKLVEQIVGSNELDDVEFVNTVKKTFREKLGLNFNINFPQLKANNEISLS